MSTALLLEINPWARLFAPAFDGAAFERARSRASRARLEAGPGALREWAAAMIAVGAARRRDPALGIAWRRLADLDLRAAPGERRPLRGLDLAGLALPGGVALNGVVIEGGASLDASVFGGALRFEQVIVQGPLELPSARVAGEVAFEEVEIAGRLDAACARFEAGFRAERCQARRDAWFRETVFAGPARFDASTVAGDAAFHFARFEDEISLRRVRIGGNLGLERARLAGALHVAGARVGKRVFSHDVRLGQPGDAAALAALASLSAGGPRLRLVHDRPADRASTA